MDERETPLDTILQREFTAIKKIKRNIDKTLTEKDLQRNIDKTSTEKHLQRNIDKTSTHLLITHLLIIYL